MDLSTVAAKIKSGGGYSSMDALKQDVRMGTENYSV
jgi:hypothetical protein